MAMALLALGELSRLGEILDVSRDDVGLMLDVDSLPQRIRKPKPLILGDGNPSRRSVISKKMTRVRVALGEHPQPVGEIVFDADGRRQTSVFRYAVEWLESPERFAIAPSVPLGESPFYASASRTNPRGSLLGPFSDSAPDSWGRGLIRKARSGELTELDYVLAVNDLARQGSLRYLDDDGIPLARSYPPIPRLNELREIRNLASAAALGRGMTASERDRLLGSAGSLGGARPKASILDDAGNLSIAKFTSDSDTMRSKELKSRR